MRILDLFEPKLPPINLLCLTPAYWFYRVNEQRQNTSSDVEKYVVPEDFIQRYEKIRRER